MTFYTADICDEHSDKVAVLGAAYKNYGGVDKCEGDVITVRLDKNNSTLIELLRDCDGAGKVVVVDVDKAFYAVVGENLMNFAAQNRYAGIVVNGYVRDTAQIRDIPVALFALGTCPRKYIPVTEGVLNCPLQIDGVELKPGDYLYADCDGIVVARTALQVTAL